MKAMVKEKGTCVMATESQGKPHCSLMTYVSDENGLSVYMVTPKNTQKYKNMIANPYVSLLIDNREQRTDSDQGNTTAMTVSGIFQAIENAAEKKKALDRLLERHPHLNDFADGETEVFCVRVSSFLLLDGLSDAYFEKV